MSLEVKVVLRTKALSISFIFEQPLSSQSWSLLDQMPLNMASPAKILDSFRKQ